MNQYRVEYKTAVDGFICPACKCWNKPKEGIAVVVNPENLKSVKLCGDFCIEDANKPNDLLGGLSLLNIHL